LIVVRSVPSERRTMDVADRELERMIERRSSKEQDPDEREELWKESVRRYNARIREENRLAWQQYHQGQAERLRRTVEPLIAFHEGQAAKLCGEGGP
jgi:superfamily II RNA helicase